MPMGVVKKKVNIIKILFDKFNEFINKNLIIKMKIYIIV